MTSDLVLPQADPPVGSYVMAARSGNLLFVSGHGPSKTASPATWVASVTP